MIFTKFNNQVYASASYTKDQTLKDIVSISKSENQNLRIACVTIEHQGYATMELVGTSVKIYQNIQCVAGDCSKKELTDAIFLSLIL